MRDEFSSWAMIANKILFSLAYLDQRRGFRPIAKWESMPDLGWGASLRRPKLLDGTLLDRCLDAKADFVRMAEKAEFERQPWTPEEFRDLCFDGFEKILGIRGGQT